ncbi:MAG: LysM peptidoglycan-binding domain-containing protein [Bacteroidia bacterium]
MRKFTFLWVCLIGFIGQIQAQKPTDNAPAFTPDTSLTYNDFLQQCVAFKKRDNVQEVWAVQFWASSSSKSLSDMVRLKQMAVKYKNKPVRFISVSTDKNVAAWNSAMLQAKAPWEQMRISNEKDYDFIKRAFKHNSIPALFVVYKNGQVKRMDTTSDLGKEIADEAKSLPDGAYKKPIILPDPPKEPPKPKFVPIDYTGWVVHVVTKGETLYSIAQRYNMSITELQTNNDLSNTMINVGQKLKVRGEVK